MATTMYAISLSSMKKASSHKPEKIPIFFYQTGKVEMVERIEKTPEEWKKILNPEFYRVSREKGTEIAFTGRYHEKEFSCT